MYYSELIKFDVSNTSCTSRKWWTVQVENGALLCDVENDAWRSWEVMEKF